MPENNQKLDRFTATILKEAVDENEQAMQDCRQRRVQAVADAKRQAAAEARAYTHEEISKIRAQAGRQVSLRMQESKRALYQRRNQIAEEVFAAVRKKITDYTAGAEYAPRLEQLLRQALTVLSGADHLRISLRESDRKYAEALQELAPDVRMEFRDGAFALGGLIAESPELGLRVDASFDRRLEELNGHFAELFGISLSDEK